MHKATGAPGAPAASCIAMHLCNALIFNATWIPCSNHWTSLSNTGKKPTTEMSRILVRGTRSLKPMDCYHNLCPLHGFLVSKITFLGPRQNRPADLPNIRSPMEFIEWGDSLFDALDFHFSKSARSPMKMLFSTLLMTTPNIYPPDIAALLKLLPGFSRPTPTEHTHRVRPEFWGGAVPTRVC